VDPSISLSRICPSSILADTAMYSGSDSPMIGSPCLNEAIPVLCNHLLQIIQLMCRKSVIPAQAYGPQPEFRLEIISRDMDMRRFIRFSAVKMNPAGAFRPTQASHGFATGVASASCSSCASWLNPGSGSMAFAASRDRYGMNSFSIRPRNSAVCVSTHSRKYPLGMFSRGSQSCLVRCE